MLRSDVTEAQMSDCLIAAGKQIFVVRKRPLFDARASFEGDDVAGIGGKRLAIVGLVPLYNLYLLLTSVSSSTSVSFDIDRCRTVAGCFGVDALDIPLPGFFHIWHKCRESHAFNG